jgi:hypothetical protein
MQIVRSRFWHWPYTYGVIWRQAYEIKDSPVGNYHKPYWAIKKPVLDYLVSLPRVKSLGRNLPAAKFKTSDGPLAFSMIANKGKISMYRDPPTIWFIRRGDILLMKLTLDV